MIRIAADIDFRRVRTCPHRGCSTRVVSYGIHEPFAVDEKGNPYCRKHAPEADSGYTEAHKNYKAEQYRLRREALEELSEPNKSSRE